jgi:tRNA G18 (ribose-2'-O)-methylase SpoU
LFLILDSLEDQHNLGLILETADAKGLVQYDSEET